MAFEAAGAEGLTVLFWYGPMISQTTEQRGLSRDKNRILTCG